MQNKCEQCGIEYEAKRTTSRYCGDKCRKLAFLGDEVSVPIVSVPRLESNPNKPLNYGQPDCQCMHCQQHRTNNSKNIISHGRYKTASELSDHEVNRVSLPGDVDYTGHMADRMTA